MKKRVTYRPGKAQGVFGIVWGGIFILIGLFVVIPIFGPFGVLWTLAAIAITVMNGFQAFGKKYAGPEIHIEEDGPSRGEAPFSPAGQAHDHIPSTALSPQKRLEQLETLKGAGLLTDQEYKQKRQEILRDL